MINAIVVVGVAAIASSIGFVCGRTWAKRRAAMWFVQPHTPRTMARTHGAEQDTPTSVEASWGRTNMPNSTSKME